MFFHYSSVFTLEKDRKFIARKGHHVTTKFLVEVIESRLGQGF
jgi:hypothetical protein